MDCCRICNDASAVPVCHGEGVTLNEPVNLCSYPHLLSQISGSDQKTRSRIEYVKTSFLRRVSGLSFKDKVKSLVIQGGLTLELLLLRIKRNQWNMAQGSDQDVRLPGEVFQAPEGDPEENLLVSVRTWRDYVSGLAWELLGILPGEQASVATEREVWVSLLGMLLTHPDSGL